MCPFELLLLLCDKVGHKVKGHMSLDVFTGRIQRALSADFLFILLLLLLLRLGRPVPLQNAVCAPTGGLQPPPVLPPQREGTLVCSHASQD